VQRSDHKQVLDFIRRSLITRHGATAAAAVATDARHCRAEMCGRKHFRFRQIYRSRPQASAGDRYPVLTSAVLAVGDITTYNCPQLNARWVAFTSDADAEYKLADAFTLSTFTDASANASTYA